MADTTAADVTTDPLARLLELAEQTLLRVECLAADWEATQSKPAPRSEQRSAPAPLVISGLRRVDKGRLLGTCDIYIPQWDPHFRGVRWQRWENGHETVNFAEREYTDKAGTKHYSKTAEFGSTKTFERFCQAAVKALHEFDAKNQPTETPA